MTAENPKRRLTRIKTGTLGRGFSLARMATSMSLKGATHAIGTLFSSSEEKEKRGVAHLTAQFKVLSEELGQLKGSLMKAGQMLSMLGEHFLPPEANAVLKSLQSQSPPLEWKGIHKVLLRELGEERLARLQIEHEPLAAASLGQVHRAMIASSGESLAVKIQYPGVDAAIDGDLRALRSLLGVALRSNAVFEEVRRMLKQEVDYTQEIQFTERFREALAHDPRYVVPKTYAEFSTRHVLATSLEEGYALDSMEVREFSQEVRNRIARSALDLYLNEIFRLGMMQTDPHFGNYRARSNGELVLLDFGAVRVFEPSFLEPYRELVRASFYGNREGTITAAGRLGYLRESDSQDQNQVFAEICELIIEPFRSAGNYDWESSDLPKRVAKKAAQIAVVFKLRSPPPQLVFLDRKMAGMFILLKVLRADFPPRPVLEAFLTMGPPVN